MCRQLSDNSASLRTALDVVVEYEKRGAAMLTHMLGSTYSLQDLYVYALAAVGIAATGLSKSLRAARLPLVGLFALSVVAERAFMHSFHHMLELDPTGEVGHLAWSLCCQGFPYVLCFIFTTWSSTVHSLDSCLGKVCTFTVLNEWQVSDALPFFRQCNPVLDNST